jgi:mono/diheme cytochrome c family protein
MKNPFKNLILAAAAMAVLVANTSVGAPVIPGFERLKADRSVSLASRGELLLGELNCLSCHPARTSINERVGTKAAPNLSRAGERLTPKYIREFLNNPHGVKPGTTMPDLFHASEGRSKAGAIDFLTHYLVSRSGPIEQSGTPVNRSAADKGKELFHSVGCIACHAPEQTEGITTPMVPLPIGLAGKTTVEHLTKFLQNPQHDRPSGRMPSLGLTEDESRSIAIYLLRDQMENPQGKAAEGVAVNGWHYDYYEPKGLKRLPDFSQLEPKASGITRHVGLNPDGLKPRNDNFALRFTANLRINKAGKHRFWFKSDDGSRLLIDGKVVGDNDGIHPANEKKVEVELKKGNHPIELQYFEGGGQVFLTLQASGPSFGKRGQLKPEILSVPDQTPMVPTGWEEFTLDPQLVRMGQMMFTALRCVSCHQVDNLAPLRPAPVLSELNLDSSSGCLGSGVRRSVPQYSLSEDQRLALKAALKDQRELAKTLAPEERIKRTMAALNCFACHRRGELGGPDDRRAELFTTNIPVDLGEEGKMPPHLDGVGAKLQKSALQAILYDGDLHTRYFMSTRMPRFGRGNVGQLIDDLVKVDLKRGDLKKPEFSEESMAIGRRLIGQTGLFCINCHLVNGGKGPGIPGVDLSTVHKRINPGWFVRLLSNPAAFNKGTRMPAFWPDGQSALPTVLDGDSTKQMAAIWNYLSLGESMPMPLGIQPVGGVGMELIPAQEPIIHRTFMEGVGPRSILAGFPERVHAAFDANIVRLAKVWRGRFFDGSGVASGRSDKFFKPLGKDIINMPAGPAFAALESQSEPWPSPEMTDRNVGGRFKGYSVDEQGRPRFRYELNGVKIEERVVPVLRPGGAILKREFTLNGSGKNFFLLAGSGKDVDHTSTTDWIVDGDLEIQIDGDGAGEAIVRESADVKQLLIPVTFTNGKAKFSITLGW